MRLTQVLRWLLFLAIGMPMLVLVVQFAGVLLAAMGDQLGARVLRAIAIGGSLFWIVVLLGLIIVVAIETLNRNEPPPRPP
jgi:hypothetical protein